MEIFKHGENGYSNYGCRCNICRIGKSIQAKRYYKTNKKNILYSVNCYRNSQHGKEIRNKYYITNKEKIIYQHKIYMTTDKGKFAMAKHDKKRRNTTIGRFKRKAVSMLNSFITRGKILKPFFCSICYNHNIQAHHFDYSKPLDVTWLCIKHHKELHTKYTQYATKEY